MRRATIASLLVISGAVIATVSFAAGINRTVARAAYIQSISIQEEAKCLASQDVECLRTHWLLRAGAAAESANRALASPLPASMSAELQAYLQWVNSRPEIRYPAKQQQ